MNPFETTGCSFSFTLELPTQLTLMSLFDRWRAVKGQRNRLRGRKRRRSWLKGESHSTSTICLRTNWSESMASDMQYIKTFIPLQNQLAPAHHYWLSGAESFQIKLWFRKMSSDWVSDLPLQGEGQWAVAVDDGAGGWEVRPQWEAEETEIWCKRAASSLRFNLQKEKLRISMTFVINNLHDKGLYNIVKLCLYLLRI